MTGRRVSAFALVLAVAAGGWVLVHQVVGERSPAPTAVPATVATSEAPVGGIDRPVGEASFSEALDVAGWALDAKGIRSVTVRLPAEALEAEYGLPRPDVAEVKPGYPNAARSGFALRHSPPPSPRARYPFDVVATNNDGRSTVLGRRSWVPPGSMQLWSPFQPSTGERPFYFLMATSGVRSGGAGEIDTIYRGYESTTQRIGVAVPILYLRTTRGASGDWAFDADFDTSRQCGNRRVADDSLSEVLAHAVAKRLPVQIILNGGIWADASCNTPEWDINDHLEADPRNCQWTQDDQVPPDDLLKNLAGSTESPEVARSLTLNVYATDVRRYKKRNLQDAARRIAQFAREHPELFVGINLDSDTYVNPFFEQHEWFDYNPGTLRQFREWLRGSGPYAGVQSSGVPDLRAFRRERALSLDEVNRLARKKWGRWSEVQPPRRFPGSKVQAAGPGELPIWDDPWYREWDTFRKHLVDLHYDELAAWTHEAGIPKDRIFTAQGFVAPEGDARPFALKVTSSGQNYDSGGVSVEGAIPRHGHLGAILYGPAAENRARMEHRHGLFATFARLDPGWAVVESNMADLRRPEQVPSYGQAYRGFRDLFNYDARQVSVMAWNGSNGIFVGQPGYVSYTSWRNTPAEEAMRDQLVSHANLPLGSRLWTFGTAQHADDDGWSAEGAMVAAEPGRIVMTPAAEEVALVSPPDQVIRKRNAAALVLGVDADALTRISVWAEREPRTGWVLLSRTADAARLANNGAGLVLPIHWPPGWSDGTIAERVRIVVAPARRGVLTVQHVALVAAATTDAGKPRRAR